jgi:S-adenosylmethionine-diacylglycerol 3-amino-3-carboxypropyl transferase
VAGGIGSAGKFENYFRLFRTRVLPAVHGREMVERLFEPRSRSQRETFFEQVWSNRRWRWMFRLFFSRFVMGWAGRDPSFFKYVEGSVSDKILARARHALIELDPSQNPYLQWIFFGSHRTALPYALRAENFDAIRNNLDRLECRVQSLEDFVRSDDARFVNSYNLSDVFEYMSEESYTRILERIVASAAPGARIAYWNLLVPRTRPETLAKRLRPRPEAARLHQADKAFFYSNFIVEEVLAE